MTTWDEGAHPRGQGGQFEQKPPAPESEVDLHEVRYGSGDEDMDAYVAQLEDERGGPPEPYGPSDEATEKLLAQVDAVAPSVKKGLPISERAGSNLLEAARGWAQSGIDSGDESHRYLQVIDACDDYDTDDGRTADERSASAYDILSSVDRAMDDGSPD